jgi:hypothetical protein
VREHAYGAKQASWPIVRTSRFRVLRVPIWAQHYFFIGGKAMFTSIYVGTAGEVFKRRESDFPHVRVVAFTNMRHGVFRELRGTKQQRTDLL